MITTRPLPTAPLGTLTFTELLDEHLYMFMFDPPGHEYERWQERKKEVALRLNALIKNHNLRST